MRRIVQSAVSFCVGLCGPIASGVAAVSDPLHWLKAVGAVSEDTTWLIPIWQRQAALLLFGFGWLFIWYHRQRVKFEDKQPVEPDMPFHKAIRYVARDSAWGYQSKEDWCGTLMDAASALFVKASEEKLTVFGRYKAKGRNTDAGRTKIAAHHFHAMQWRHLDLIGPTPPSHIITDAGDYMWMRVSFNRLEVTKAFPRPSLRKRITKASALQKYERDTLLDEDGYRAICRKQDENYDRNPEMAVVADMPALREVFGP